MTGLGHYEKTGRVVTRNYVAYDGSKAWEYERVWHGRGVNPNGRWIRRKDLDVRRCCKLKVCKKHRNETPRFVGEA